MLDKDLADLYGVGTRTLIQAVKRNIDRFPEDFCFQLHAFEVKNMRSQFVIASTSKRNLRFYPYAFTEQGIAMLSSVLRSKQAILVNIQIMRTFTKIREMLVSNKALRDKIEKLENKYGSQFKVVFNAIKRLIATDSKSLSQIGFRTDK